MFWPEAPSTPVQPDAIAFALPPAVQEVALEELQLTVVVVSAGMDADPSVSVGAAGTTRFGVAVKVTLAAADGPPRLLHVSVYVCGPTAVGVIVSLPLAASVPLHAPDAVQPVAPVEDHASVVELPTVTEGEPSVRVGVAGGVPEVTGRIAELEADVPTELAQVSV